MEQIPLERLVGPAVVIDVTLACARNRDYLVDVGDLQGWEARHGQIPRGAIVLLHTGFGRFWPDRERYLGTAARGAEAATPCSCSRVCGRCSGSWREKANGESTCAGAIS